MAFRRAFLTSAFVSTVTLAGGHASAAVLTFDTFVPLTSSYTEAGMTISTTSASASEFSVASRLKFPPGITPHFDQIELVTGSIFNLISLEVTHSDLGDPLLFEGFLGSTRVSSYEVNEDNAGPITFFDFQGLDRVLITVTGEITDASIDNIVYENVSVVPLPGTLPFLGLGVLALSVLRARRKQAALT